MRLSFLRADRSLSISALDLLRAGSLLRRLAFNRAHSLLDNSFHLIGHSGVSFILGRRSFLLLNASRGRGLGAWLGCVRFRLGDTGFLGG